MVSPRKSKKKADMLQDRAPAPDYNHQQDHQANVIMDDVSENREASFRSFNPQIQSFAAQSQPKTRVAISSLMKHTGSKEELYRTLTVQGK